MLRTALLVSLVALPLIACRSAAETEPEAKVAPIVAVDGVSPNDAAFAESGATKPIVIKSAEDAGKYFDKDAAAKLAASVDFKQQVVLVFAWRGSGQDKLDYTVAESYPEQVRFTYSPGLTKDLREHVRVFALRSNVTWAVAGGR